MKNLFFPNFVEKRKKEMHESIPHQSPPNLRYDYDSLMAWIRVQLAWLQFNRSHYEIWWHFDEKLNVRSRKMNWKIISYRIRCFYIFLLFILSNLFLFIDKYDASFLIRLENWFLSYYVRINWNSFGNFLNYFFFF